MHVLRAVKSAGEAVVEPLIRAADDREVLVIGQIPSDAAGNAHNGAAAHAAAHHHKVLMVGGNAEGALGLLLADAGLEHLAHGNAAGAHSLGRDAAAEKV